VPPEEIAPLHHTLVVVTDLTREVGRLAFGDGFPDRFRHRVHGVWLGEEPGDDLLVASPAVGRTPCISGQMGSDICGLAADAVRVPEIRSPSLWRVDCHLLQELGQPDHMRVLGRQRPTAVLHDQVTGEDDLVPLPVRISAPLL
jgi:hypothetical protein